MSSITPLQLSSKPLQTSIPGSGILHEITPSTQCSWPVEHGRLMSPLLACSLKGLINKTITVVVDAIALFVSALTSATHPAFTLTPPHAATRIPLRPPCHRTDSVAPAPFHIHLGCLNPVFVSQHREVAETSPSLESHRPWRWFIDSGIRRPASGGSVIVVCGGRTCIHRSGRA